MGFDWYWDLRTSGLVGFIDCEEFTFSHVLFCLASLSSAKTHAEEWTMSNCLGVPIGGHSAIAKLTLVLQGLLLYKISKLSTKYSSYVELSIRDLKTRHRDLRVKIKLRVQMCEEVPWLW